MIGSDALLRDRRKWKGGRRDHRESASCYVWLLHVGLGAIDFEPQWWVSVPSFAGCYSGLHWLFDRYVWRLGFSGNSGSSRCPIYGNWVGEVESSYSHDGSAHSVSAVIVQRWSKVVLRFETEHSRSNSTTARLRTSDLPNPELSYQYINEPKPNAPATMEMHKGTATLELTSSGLEGDYYTGRGRGEVGTVKLRRP